MITVTPQPPTNITIAPNGAPSITFASPQAITVEVAAAVIIGDSSGGGVVPMPSLPVAQNISALRIVANLNNLYDYANPLDPIAAWSIAGITLQSVNSGGLIAPVNNQPITDQSWNWVRGSPVFLGPLGTLTQTPPTTGNLVVVARVFDPKTIFIHIEDPIAL